MGPAKAGEILARLANPIQATPFEFLRPSQPHQNHALLRNEPPQTIALVVANLPILMLYPFLQKYFVKGVMIGALKG